MYKKYVKRFFDVLGSLILIVILSPLFIITGALVFLSLGFPVIFKQTREGINREGFTIYKFRTMNFDLEKNRNERMTKVTKALDRLRLNELPQLINVLKGDMSLIGPRPFIPGNLLSNKEKSIRYSVKPGITGLAQVNGGRYIPKSKKIEYDEFYVDNVSLFLDLKILLLTPIKIFKCK